MDFLKICRAAIVGWSDGAIVGLTIAMQYPNRLTKLFAFGANFNLKGLIPSGIHSVTFTAYRARAAAEYKMLSPQPDQYGVLVDAMKRMWDTEPNFSEAQLATIRIPVVVAGGDHDEIISTEHSRQLARAIPSASLLIEADVSHFAMLPEPAPVHCRRYELSGLELTP